MSDRQPDPLALLSSDGRAVATRFGVTAADVIGSGGESVVFALGDERVLRVPRGHPPSAGQLARKTQLMADLAGRLPYATPIVLACDPATGHTIETRIPGRAMADVLTDTGGDARKHLWQNYVDAVAALASVSRPEVDYRQLLADRPVAGATWPGFVAASMQGAVSRNRSAIERDVGSADAVLDAALALTATLAVAPPRVLVHGDAFPGNVMVDDDGRVTGLLDFGAFTVAGDHRLDLAGALLPLEMLDYCTPADAAEVRRLIVERYDEDILPQFRCYRAWFALFLADPAAGAFPYPGLYDWALRNVRWLLAGAPGAGP